MNIHIYISGSADKTDDLIKFTTNINTIDNNLTIETININSLFNNEINNLLIFVDLNINELNLLIDQKEKLINNRIIIILSENSSEIINKAYLLNPRIIDFSDNGYRQITEIVQKISSINSQYSYSPGSFNSPGGSL